MTTKLLNNRYQVIQVLGSGGFGDTFLAEDVHMPSRRRCVIKQLKPVTKDPKTYQMIQQRFEREAATLEVLGEENNQIPKLYAYFSEQGQFYLVQEWIQGQTLTDVVNAKGSLNEGEVREILLSLLSVLDYVHSKGIIHRDIKPENIILRSFTNKPVLIDFGAVKETIRSVATTSGNLTQSIIIGTPGYMSSEQAIGRPVYATDIYSLGVTAVYLLTGKRPHELETHPQTGNILWRQHAPGVSSSLAEILDRAIKQNAGERYTTASKMLYALQSVTAPPTVIPQTATGQATIPLSVGATASAQNTQLHPDRIKNPTISTFSDWQKPAWIAGALVVGSLIGAVAIASMSRQPEPEVSDASPVIQQTHAANTTTPSPSPTVTPTTESNRNMPRAVVPPPVAVAPDPVVNNPPEQPVETSTPTQSPENSTPQEQEEASTSQPAPEQSPQEESIVPVATAPQPEERQEPPASEETSDPKPPKAEKEEKEEEHEEKEEKQKVATANTGGGNVPAFPVGTPEDAVRSTLGRPSKRSRGLWNTRAYIYTLEPNRIDLGYLFDRRTGVLRQTEVAFAQSVEQEVMKNTLQGMLGGSASGEIKQGLQKVYDRQSNNYSFNLGSLRGVIQRNNEDQIYIGVWDADLRK